MLVVVLGGCRGCVKSNWHHYEVDASVRADSLIDRWLAPYRDLLHGLMSETLAVAVRPVCKREDTRSELSQLVATAQLWSVGALVGRWVRAGIPVLSVINYHGLRVACIDSGLVTVREIYELMPFDNEVVVIEGDCEVARWLAQQVRQHQGWGMLVLNGEALTRADTCVLVLSDYLAQGGSRLERLRGVPFRRTGVLVRQAIINYVDTLNLLGKPLQSRWQSP